MTALDPLVLERFINAELRHMMLSNQPDELPALVADKSTLAEENEAIAAWMIGYDPAELEQVREVAHEYLIDYNAEEFSDDQCAEYQALVDFIDKAFDRVD